MIVDTKQDNVETNIGQARQFSVTENSSKLFSLLSTVLYTNKELAVIHENCANAYDEQKECGKGHIPITVIAPTPLDSSFTVIDNGRGLSEDDVYRLLTTYGESTKNKSNTSIGGWGVGFKSSAAVTDNWTVVSKHKGVRKEYLIFVDSHGIPSITKLSESETDDTGLEVKIPVNPSRTHIWKDAIHKAFEFYEVKPIVKNMDIRYPESKPLLTVDNWKFGNVNRGVVTSNRFYSIDHSSIAGEFKSSDFVQILTWPIEIKCNIGDVDMSLSRESLQYTRRTYDYFERVYSEIYTYFYNAVRDVLVTSTGDIHRRQLCHEVRSKIFGVTYRSDYDNFIKHVLNSEYPNSIVTGSLSDYIAKVSFKMACHQNKPPYQNTVNGCDMITPITAIRASSLSTRRLDSNFHCWGDNAITYSPSNQELRINISQFSKIAFVVNDIGRNVNSVVRYNLSHGACLKGISYALVSEKFDFLPSDMQHMVVKASALIPVPAAAKTQAAPRQSFKRADVYAVDYSAFRRLKDDEEIASGSYYVNVENFTQSAFNSCKMLTDNAHNFKILGMTVYAVRTCTPAPDGLVEVEKALKERIAKLMAGNVIDEYVSWRANIMLSRKNIFSFIKSVGAKFKKATVIGSFIDQIQSDLSSNKASELSDQYRIISACYDALKIKNPVACDIEDKVNKLVDAKMKELYNTYAMLKYFEFSHREHTAADAKKAIEDYVSIIGK